MVTPPKVDFHNHFSGAFKPTGTAPSWLQTRLDAAIEEIQQFENFSLGIKYYSRLLEKCPDCAQRLALVRSVDGFEVMTCKVTQSSDGTSKHGYTSDPCPFALGVPPFDVTIKVPSGKLAFFNSLGREHDPVSLDRRLELDINYILGRVAFTKEEALYNILYVQCGNTSVSAYRTKEGISFHHSYASEKVEGEPIGGPVCCDVWWFTAMDLEDLKTHLNTQDPGEAFKAWGRDFYVLDVKPGAYTFKMIYSYDEPETSLLAEGKWGSL